jgi:hypothetical protein
VDRRTGREDSFPTSPRRPDPGLSRRLELDAVIAATWLLFVLGLLGAADILLYHTLSHGIRKHPNCRSELLVHSLRGPTYALLFIAVPNLALRGLWTWALHGLLVFDLWLSLWDFAIEGRSRSAFGGLPAGEYVLHVLLGILFGAFAALVIDATAARAALPTAVAYEPVSVPTVLRWVLAGMAAGVLASGALDALAWRRLRGPSRSAC